MLPSGTQLGPYEILAVIGAGGMGEVYRARDTRLGREVAIKVAHQRLDERFTREAQTIAALNHPNLCALYDVGPEYLVMELLEGETLRQRLNAGKLESRRAVEYAIQIARGLAAAHDKGITHRDLKPENIFLCSDGRVKILDFGLAKLSAAVAAEAPTVADAGAGALTAPGVVLGTFGYMSPEQVRGQATDARSDIFSFGAVLYEMLAGRRAFAGDSAADVMSAILKEEPPEPDADALASSPAWTVARHCLEKEPRQRYQSASDIAFQLGSWSGGTTTAAAAMAVRAPRRGPWRQVAAAVVLLAGGGVAAHWLWPKAASPPPIVVPLTSHEQILWNARYAAQSNAIVFSASDSGTVPQLYQLHPDYPLPQAFGDADTDLLSVSKQDQLAVLTGAKFLGQRLFLGTLAEQSLGGSTPRPLLQNVTDADWNPDGTQMAVVHMPAGPAGPAQIEYPIGHVLLSETSGYISDLRVSPRGDRIAFFEHPIRFDDRGTVDVMDLAGHKTVLPGEWGVLEGLTWAADGNSVYFGGGADQVYNLALFNAALDGRGAGKARLVETLAERAIPLDALRPPEGDTARTGALLLSSSQQTGVIEARGGNWPQERDIAFLSGSFSPVAARDGSAVLFSEASGYGGPYYAVMLRKFAQPEPTQIGEGWGLALSADGAWALSAVPRLPLQLMVYPTGAGEKHQLNAAGLTAIDSGSFFPDGQRVLFCGSRTGQTGRCYVESRDGGAPTPMLAPGSDMARVSPDGTSIVAWQPSDVWKVYPAAGGAGRVLTSFPHGHFDVQWTADSRGLLISRTNVPSTTVQRLDLASGALTTVRALTPANTQGEVAIDDVSLGADLGAYAYGFVDLRARLIELRGVR